MLFYIIWSRKDRLHHAWIEAASPGRGTISLGCWGLQLPLHRFRSELITLVFLLVSLNLEIHAVIDLLPSHMFQIIWNTFNYLILHVILCELLLNVTFVYNNEFCLIHKLWKFWLCLNNLFLFRLLANFLCAIFLASSFWWLEI